MSSEGGEEQLRLRLAVEMEGQSGAGPRWRGRRALKASQREGLMATLPGAAWPEVGSEEPGQAAEAKQVTRQQG